MHWLRNWSSEQLICVYGDVGFEEHAAEFSGRHRDFVRARIAAVSGSWVPRPDIDDVEGEVWAKLPAAKHRYILGDEGSALAWLGMVVQNITVDHGRKLGRLPESASKEQLDEVAREPAPVEEFCEERESVESVFGVLATLPHENQAIMALVEDGGFGLLTLVQVGQLLGCAPATVQRRREKTHDLLRQALVEQEDQK